MSRFDEMDRRAAAAVGRLLNDPVRWRPMVPGTGGSYTRTTAKPDTSRPVRDLEAIVTWAPTNTPTGDLSGGSSVANATLMLDFEAVLFTDEHGVPRRGYRFELRDEALENRLVEVARGPAEDGSWRIFLYGTGLKGGGA